MSNVVTLKIENQEQIQAEIEKASRMLNDLKDQLEKISSLEIKISSSR